MASQSVGDGIVEEMEMEPDGGLGEPYIHVPTPSLFRSLRKCFERPRYDNASGVA